MHTFTHTHTYLHLCVYTQKYVLIHIQIPRTPYGREKFLVPKAQSLAGWTSLAPAGPYPLWHHSLHNWESEHHGFPNQNFIGKCCTRQKLCVCLDVILELNCCDSWESSIRKKHTYIISMFVFCVFFFSSLSNKTRLENTLAFLFVGIFNPIRLFFPR